MNLTEIEAEKILAAHTAACATCGAANWRIMEFGPYWFDGVAGDPQDKHAAYELECLHCGMRTRGLLLWTLLLEHD